MATVQEIYNEIDRIDNAKSGIAGAIEEKGVEVPAGAKIDEYPELVRQIQQGDTSDCVKFTPQTLTEEQKAQARENIGAGGGGDGKMGIISQTQTWSGTGSNPRTYTIDPASIVRGLIPQANIDLFEAAGATFNTLTGYFEMNGLTDLSYENMLVVERYKGLFDAISRVGGNGCLRSLPSTLRTTTKLHNSAAVGFGYGLFGNAEIEVVGANEFSISGVGNAFMSCPKLKAITGVIKFGSGITSTSNAFAGAYSLQDIQISSLNAAITFSNSSLLTAASVAYMITNAGTATITITLHATAYARAIADAGVQAALQSKTNVSLASA